MKNKLVFLFSLAFFMIVSVRMPASAASDSIKTGVFAEDLELSGLTREEAEAKIEAFVDGLKTTEITLIAAEGNEVHTTAGELGLYWSNPQILDDALTIGIRGNVVERYKVLKDLQYDNKIYDIKLNFDMQAINDIISTKAVKYDCEAEDAVLKREKGKFTVTPEKLGYSLDVEDSIDIVYDNLRDWNRKPAKIALSVSVTEPKGKAEDLEQVTDVLGSFTTYFIGSGFGRAANIINGCRMIDGTVLYPGEQFESNDAMGPFTPDNGYYAAGSYLNGQVVDSIGGGVCQISSTLYNAVLLAELEVTMRYNHSMTVTYVKLSEDAALAEEAGKDFKFVNNTDYPIYIECYVTNNEEVTFKIYGKETRPSTHSVRYENEVLEVIPPEEVINVDAGLPLGYISVQNGYTGYKAKLWKITSENGVDVSREQVNSSSYRSTKKTATVGIATDNPDLANELNQAIATGSIDAVRATLDAIAARSTESWE